MWNKATFSEKHSRRRRMREDMAANGLQRSTGNKGHGRTRVSYDRVRFRTDLDVERLIHIAPDS